MLNDMATALAEDAARPDAGAVLCRSSEGRDAGPARGGGSGGCAWAAAAGAVAGLAWFDMMRTGRGTANMIQAQRDFFGAHGFERLDQAGTGLHGPWGGHMV